MTRERLQSYTVHERPDFAADRVMRAEALEFVSDGFARAAFPLPPAWLAMHGIWIGVLAYMAAAAAILGLVWLFDLPNVMTLLGFLALHLLFASEAGEMLRARLAVRGWAMVGQITGTGRLDCERRFFDQWLASVPIHAAPTASTPAAAGPPPPLQAQPSPSRPAAGHILGNLLSPLRPRDNS